MLGLAGPSAITTHYSTHLIDALDSARRFGYGEMRSEVGGNALLSVRLPWLCIFCVYNHALPVDQRLGPANQVVGDSTSKSRVKHLKAHFDDIEGRAYCPASAASGAEGPLCTLSAELNTEELAAHLIKVHGVFDVQHILDSVERRKAAKKGGKMMHEDTPEEAQDVPEPQSLEVLKGKGRPIFHCIIPRQNRVQRAQRGYPDGEEGVAEVVKSAGLGLTHLMHLLSILGTAGVDSLHLRLL